MENVSGAPAPEKWYNKNWLVAILFIFLPPVGIYALWKNTSISKPVKAGIAVLTTIVVIAAIPGKSKKDSSTAPTSAVTTTGTDTSVTPVAEETTEPEPAWSYEEDENEMDGQKRYFASNFSTNQVHFPFPYNGGSTLALTIRNMGQGNDVVLRISKGQFVTSIASTETLRAKFDDGKPITFSHNSASDGSMDIIFIDNSAKFISLLKKAKKLMIEVQFYEAGNKIFYFDVEDLKWDR